MQIQELSIDEFNLYAKSHPLSNHAQTSSYALVMSDHNYEYELIGLIDELGEIHAASLILIKKLNGINYGYAPKGFLIDYTDKNLLITFTNLLKKHFYKKEVAFIKINPEIPIANINNTTFERKENENINVINTLKEIGYEKLKDNLYFESMFPRFTGIIDLKKFHIKNISKNTRNKIKKSIKKGLEFIKVDNDYIHILNSLVERNDFFLDDLYSIYAKDNNADLFIVKLNKEKYLDNSQSYYNKEYDINQDLNDKMIKKAHTKNINKKMNSDISLLAHKKNLMEASKLIDGTDDLIIGAALIIKNQDKVKIIECPYDKKYKRFMTNYFIHYNIIKYYHNTHSILELNGITGNFSKDSPFYGLNCFKLGFKPKVYEFIGEFDLIIEPKAFKHILKSKLLLSEYKTKH